MRFGNSCAREVMLDYLLGDNKDLIMNVNFLSDPGWIIKTSIAKSRTNNLTYKSHLLLKTLCKNDKVVQDVEGSKLKEIVVPDDFASMKFIKKILPGLGRTNC